MPFAQSSDLYVRHFLECPQRRVASGEGWKENKKERNYRSCTDPAMQHQLVSAASSTIIVAMPTTATLAGASHHSTRTDILTPAAILWQLVGGHFTESITQLYVPQFHFRRCNSDAH